MCGRFALSILPGQFQDLFGTDMPQAWQSSWNITPDRPIIIVTHGGHGSNHAAADLARWGLLGPWMKEAGAQGRQINARSETAAEKPMFRHAFRHGRCIIPADGFYEWQKVKGVSQPFFVAREDGASMAMAGLYRTNRLLDGSELVSCAILTMAASPTIADIHHRMPVILEPDDFTAWLDPQNEAPQAVIEALSPSLRAWPVSRRVNSPRNNDAGLTEPAQSATNEEEPAPPEPPRQQSLF